MKMRSKKNLILMLSLILSVALVLSGCSSTPAAPDTSKEDSTGEVKEEMAKPDKVYKWRMQSTENDTISMYRERNVIFEKIKEETNGGLIITQFAGGSIVSDANIPDSVKQGAIEMGNVYLNPLYATVPVSEMVGITPGFIFDVADSITFMNSYGVQDIFQAEIEKKLNSYAWPELTGAVLVCSNKPITEVEDFKGLQIRSYGPLGNIYNKLGASVVNVSGGEVYTALSTGLIDAANWGAYQGGVGAKLYEVTDYFVEPTMGVGCGTINMVNKDKFNELPAEYQNIVLKYFSNRQADAVFTSNSEEMAAKQLMLDSGMKASPLSEDAKTKLREMALVEMEKLSHADEASAEVYEKLLIFLEHQEALKWK